MPRSMHLHTEIYRIWKVYLNYSKCTWKVSILLHKYHVQRASCNQTLGFLRLYGDSRVSRAQPCINAYEILLQHVWLLFFSRHNRFAETHSHLQLSYHITDRLLAAGNKYKLNFKYPSLKLGLLITINMQLGHRHFFNTLYQCFIFMFEI